MLKAVCLIHFKPRLSNFLWDGTYKRDLWINTGGTETKNIKNSLLAMPVLCTCR